MSKFSVNDSVQISSDSNWSGSKGTIVEVYAPGNYWDYRVNIESDNPSLRGIHGFKKEELVPANSFEVHDDITIEALMFAALNHPNHEFAMKCFNYARQIAADDPA
jgi:hypothetical protein